MICSYKIACRYNKISFPNYQIIHVSSAFVIVVVAVVVDCGLTSHSAIFQLYSDGTDVQFPNFDLLPGTHALGS